ncbi:hypothetical protein ACFU5O_15095 [Streptomyces sp. NPDC057445]|uniref:hypothetical protein n=1 Tax=Streptomyces sp. NPDC057445 TaxID=3346136 RepID=UPI0036CB1E79
MGAAARIRERNATVAGGPLGFGAGRAALVADRDGAVLVSGRSGSSRNSSTGRSSTGQEQAPAWLELRTGDAFDTAIFYAEVLDRACEQPTAVR